MIANKLTRVRVSGFRSLKDVELELTPVTVLIGPNGAGKSNLLWALEMVRMLAFESLQLFVGERGGASYLMHYGPRQSPVMNIELEFTTEQGENSYQARLGYGADESLIFLGERAGFRKPGGNWRWTELGAGHRETRLRELADTDVTAKTVLWLLRKVNFYHFHDTSRTSVLRTASYADLSGDYLRSDGSNLPIFLLGLRESADDSDKVAYNRIQYLVQRVAPFIKELRPTEDPRRVRLEWVDDKGEAFGPAHLSDGTLRAIALIAALAQPNSRFPLLSCVDEPELGLHPLSLGLVCELIASVSTRRQAIVATQSPVVLDHFEPKDIVVAERQDGATAFRRLSNEALESWLEDYSLSEVYEKNVFGGLP